MGDTLQDIRMQLISAPTCSFTFRTECGSEEWIMCKLQRVMFKGFNKPYLT